MRIEFTIPVNPRPKKNSPMILWRKQDFKIKIGARVLATIPFTPFIVPSKGFSDFENEIMPFLKRLKDEVGVIDYPCNIQAVYYRSTKHTIDLTNLNEALHDAMVKSGCILDDNRDIIAAHDGSRVFHDKFNPRIEITITELTDYTQWNDTTTEQIKLL